MHPTIKYFAVYVGKQLVWVAQFLISTRLQINHNDEAVINTTFFQMPNKQVEQKKDLPHQCPPVMIVVIPLCLLCMSLFKCMSLLIITLLIFM